MDSKKKIRIIADKLDLYLEEWRSKVTDLNSFYYLAHANLRVYEDYLEGRELDENENELIKEALEFKEVKFGKYKYKF